MEEIFGPGRLIAPDLWIKKATGAPVGPEALLNATRKALAALGPNAGKAE